MDDDVKSALEFVRKWHENDPDGKHTALGAAVTLRNYILSPTAAGPGLDAEAFVMKCINAGRAHYDSAFEPHGIIDLSAELRAALGTGEGDDSGPSMRGCERCKGRGFLGHPAPGQHGFIGTPKCPVCLGSDKVIDAYPAPNEGGVK